jgi:hypothetical protein
VNAPEERTGVLYHKTARNNLPAICEQGIRPVGGEHRAHLAEELAVTASENGLLYPIDRQECVFFYPEPTEALQSVRSGTEARATGFGNDVEVVVVVDIDRIKNDLFVGDFKLFGDIIDFQFMDTPDDAMVTESYDDAVQQYLETLTPVTTHEHLEKLCEGFHLPEVLVEGGVNPDAIVEVQSQYLTKDPRLAVSEA